MKEKTQTYPRVMYRWIADILIDGTAFSAGSLAMFAVEKGLLRHEHAGRLRIITTRMMGKVAPDTKVKINGALITGWRAETWRMVLYKNATEATKRIKYRFLVEKALDGDRHHPSSLAWLMTEAEAKQVGACNLEAGRIAAYQWLSQLRRERILVEYSGLHRR